MINASNQQLEQLIHFFDQNEFDAFFNIVDGLLVEFHQQQHTEDYITCLLYKSTAYFRVQNSLLATQILAEEAELIEQYATPKQKVRYYNLLAAIHAISLNYDEAYEYLHIAKRLAEKINDHEKLVHIYNNLAMHYYKYENYEKALFYADKSLSYHTLEPNHDYLTITLNYIRVLLKLKQFEKANNYLSEIKSKIDFTADKPKYTSYIRVEALNLTEQNNWQGAYELLQNALSNLQHDIYGQHELYEELCKISKQHHEPPVYLGHLKKLFTLKKQLSSQKKKQQLETIRYYFDNRSIKEDSWTDPLTNIYNRRYLEENYPNFETPFACFIFDLDNFKDINDRYGHQTGDKVLQIIAKHVNQFIASLNGHLVRLGGDEFFGLFPIESKSLLYEEIEKLMEIFHSTPIEIDNYRIPLTISSGVLFCKQQHILEDTLKEVDRALYKAKQNGRNQFIII